MQYNIKTIILVSSTVIKSFIWQCRGARKHYTGLLKLDN